MSSTTNTNHEANNGKRVSGSPRSTIQSPKSPITVSNAASNPSHASTANHTQSSTGNKAMIALTIVLQHLFMKWDLGWSMTWYEQYASELRKLLIRNKSQVMSGTHSEEQQQQEIETTQHLYDTSIGFLDHGHLHYLQGKFEFRVLPPMIPADVTHIPINSIKQYEKKLNDEFGNMVHSMLQYQGISYLRELVKQYKEVHELVIRWFKQQMKRPRFAYKASSLTIFQIYAWQQWRKRIDLIESALFSYALIPIHIKQFMLIKAQKHFSSQDSMLDRHTFDVVIADMRQQCHVMLVSIAQQDRFKLQTFFQDFSSNLTQLHDALQHYMKAMKDVYALPPVAWSRLPKIRRRRSSFYGYSRRLTAPPISPDVLPIPWNEICRYRSFLQVFIGDSMFDVASDVCAAKNYTYAPEFNSNVAAYLAETQQHQPADSDDDDWWDQIMSDHHDYYDDAAVADAFPLPYDSDEFHHLGRRLYREKQHCDDLESLLVRIEKGHYRHRFDLAHGFSLMGKIREELEYLLRDPYTQILRERAEAKMSLNPQLFQYAIKILSQLGSGLAISKRLISWSIQRQEEREGKDEKEDANQDAVPNNNKNNINSIDHQLMRGNRLISRYYHRNVWTLLHSELAAWLSIYQPAWFVNFTQCLHRVEPSRFERSIYPENHSCLRDCQNCLSLASLAIECKKSLIEKLLLTVLPGHGNSAASSAGYVADTAPAAAFDLENLEEQDALMSHFATLTSSFIHHRGSILAFYAENMTVTKLEDLLSMMIEEGLMMFNYQLINQAEFFLHDNWFHIFLDMIQLLRRSIHWLQISLDLKDSSTLATKDIGKDKEYKGKGSNKPSQEQQAMIHKLSFVYELMSGILFYVIHCPHSSRFYTPFLPSGRWQFRYSLDEENLRHVRIVHEQLVPILTRWNDYYALRLPLCFVDDPEEIDANADDADVVKLPEVINLRDSLSLNRFGLDLLLQIEEIEFLAVKLESILIKCTRPKKEQSLDSESHPFQNRICSNHSPLVVSLPIAVLMEDSRLAMIDEWRTEIMHPLATWILRMLVSVGPPPTETSADNGAEGMFVGPCCVNLPLLEPYLFWIEKVLTVLLMQLESRHLIRDGRMMSDLNVDDTDTSELQTILNRLSVVVDQLENEAMVTFHNVLFTMFASNDCKKNQMQADEWFQYDMSHNNEFGLLFDAWFEQFQVTEKAATLKLLKESAIAWQEEYHRLLMNEIQYDNEHLVMLPHVLVFNLLMK